MEQRRGKADLGESQIADDRALGQLRDRQPDHGREREHRVHQALIERW
ncbi:Uncharacterised protein [Mycobacteroides abscessus subsp. massiliense]|nr:Uncharacterised protein [Mycobacteroides abscessus subsp. massiliense]